MLYQKGKNIKVKKVLVDVNVLMDVIQSREGFASSLKLLTILRKQENYIGFISALTVPILYYFESRKYSDIKTRSNIQALIKNLTIISWTDVLIQKAFDDITIPDFEDCIQYISAKTVFCDAIITRNVKDFRKAEIEVYTPEDFLSIII